MSLPADVPQAFTDLPEAVCADPSLVVSLARLVETYRSGGSIGIESEVPTGLPKRKLQAIGALARSLRTRLDRVPANSILAAYSFSPLRELSQDLAEIERTASFCSDELKPRRGTRPDWRRRALEFAVARELLRSGIKLTKARGGTLAKTLVVVLDASGITSPELDSLFPTLRDVVDSIAWVETNARRYGVRAESALIRDPLGPRARA